MTSKILISSLDLLLPIAIGYLLKRQSYLRDEFFNKMILNNILVVYPLLSFLCFWVLPLSRELIWLPVMGVLMGLVPGMIATWRSKQKYTSPLDQGGYVMSAILSNLGTIGGLCVFLLYGETGYAYQQLVVLSQYILMFMFCYPLAQRYYEQAQNNVREHSVSIRSVLFSRNQLAVVGILLGVVLQLADIERPAYLSGVSSFLVHLGAWTALIPVGYSMDFARIRTHYRELVDLAVIKFAISPLLLYLIAFLLIDNDIMRYALVILSFTPTAVNAVITARIYGLNLHLTMAAFISTTLLFLILIYPALFFLLPH